MVSIFIHNYRLLKIKHRPRSDPKIKITQVYNGG